MVVTVCGREEIIIATSWEGAEVGCPFYRENQAVAIKCEGPMDGSGVTISFLTKERRKAAMAAYCKRNWKQCPMFQAVCRKYEGK